MAKRKLNQGMRDRLRRFAEDVVSPTEAKRRLDEAYAKAAPLVRSAVEAKFPPKDMAICSKYQVAKVDDCIKLSLPDSDVAMFRFESGTGPLVTSMTYHGQIYLADEPTAAAFEEWKAAKEEYDKERKERIAAYRALIEGSNYLDDLATVWPEAAALFPSDNPLIALGPDQIALVKADVQERSQDKEAA